MNLGGKKTLSDIKCDFLNFGQFPGVNIGLR